MGRRLVNVVVKVHSCPWCGVDDPEVCIEEAYGDGTYLYRHTKASCFETFRA